MPSYNKPKTVPVYKDPQAGACVRTPPCVSALLLQRLRDDEAAKRALKASAALFHLCGRELGLWLGH